MDACTAGGEAVNRVELKVRCKSCGQIDRRIEHGLSWLRWPEFRWRARRHARAAGHETGVSLHVYTSSERAAVPRSE